MNAGNVDEGLSGVKTGAPVFSTGVEVPEVGSDFPPKRNPSTGGDGAIMGFG